MPGFNWLLLRNPYIPLHNYCVKLFCLSLSEGVLADS
nr:MAG TPA: hypothetical protein [Caudoviricetes sp.]